MPGNRGIVLACFIVMVLVCAENCANPISPDRFANTDTLTVPVGRHTIEIPRFKPTSVRLSDARYAFDQKVVSSLKEEIITLTDNVLIKGYGWLYLSMPLASLGMKLRKLSVENAELKLVDDSPRLHSGLGVTNGKMLDNMIAVGRGERLEKVSEREAQERVVVLMEAIEKLTAISNTGLVLEYPKMRIDGRNLEEYLKPSVQMLLKKNKLLSGTIRLAAVLMRRTKEQDDSVPVTGGKGISVSEAEDAEIFKDEFRSVNLGSD